MAIGTVLFTKENDYGQFGFILDDAIGFEDRETNVYFDQRSYAQGVNDITKGQRIRFEYDDKSERPRTKFKTIEPL